MSDESVVNKRETLPKTDKELRMRYYQGIKSRGEFSETFIQPTKHWLNSNIFSINPDFGK